MRHGGSQKDTNHHAIVAEFIRLGAQVADLTHVGNGMPDILVYCRNATHLVEIKNPKNWYGKRGANKNQKTFAKNWPAKSIYIVRTIEDVAAFVAGDLSKLQTMDVVRGPEAMA